MSDSSVLDVLEKDIVKNQSFMGQLLFKPEQIFEVIENYLRFANGGTIDFSCFPDKKFMKIQADHYMYFKQYFPYINSNTKNIHNYRFIDHFLFSIVSKFLCYDGKLILDSRHIMVFMQLFERVCFLYYHEIVVEEPAFVFSQTERGYVFEYKFFALAIYTAILYSNCLYIRTMARVKMNSKTKKIGFSQHVKLYNLHEKLSCDDIDIEDVGRFLKCIKLFKSKTKKYNLYINNGKFSSHLLRVGNTSTKKKSFRHTRKSTKTGGKRKKTKSRKQGREKIRYKTRKQHNKSKQMRERRGKYNIRNNRK